MKTIKKALALVLSCALLLSCMYIPAFAADNEASFTLTMNRLTGSPDSGLTQGAEVGADETLSPDEYVLLTLGTDALSISEYQVTLNFDSDVVSFQSELKKKSGFGGGASVDDTLIEDWSTKTYNLQSDGESIITGGSHSENSTFEDYETTALYKFVFRVNSGVESADGAKLFWLSQDASTKAKIGYRDETNSTQQYTPDITATLTASINGVAPQLTTVTLQDEDPTDKLTVNVAGGTADAQTVQAEAFSAMTTPMTNSVAWDFEPPAYIDKETCGVTISDAGLITVVAKAKAGVYVIIAAQGEGETMKTAAATLTVERADSAFTSVVAKADGEDVEEIALPMGDATATVALAAVDQFGDPITEGVTYALTSTGLKGVSLAASGKAIIVSSGAKANDFTENKLTVGFSAQRGDTTKQGSFVITREDSKATSVVVTCDSAEAETIGFAASGEKSGTQTFTATVYDQYGDATDDKATLSFTATIDGSSVSFADTEIKLDGGKVVVYSAAKNKIAKGKSAELTITATFGEGADAVPGTAANKVTVTREASVLTSIEVSGPATLTFPTSTDKQKPETFTVQGKDQFGEDYAVSASDFTWTLTPSDNAFVTKSENTVKVLYGANDEQKAAIKTLSFTMSADKDALNASTTFKVVDIDITQQPTVTVKTNPTYGDAWAQLVTVSGGKAELDGAEVIGSFVVEYDKDGAAVNMDALPDAGEYHYAVKFKNDEYNVPVSDGTVTVGKRTVTPTIGAISSREYTGSAIEPTLKVTWKNAVSGHPVTDSDYTVSYENNTNVGTATAKITPKEDSNYTFTEASKDFTITKQKLTKPTALDATSFVYDGTQKTVTPTGFDAEKMTITGNTGKDAGSYTATVALKDNYMWADSTTKNLTFKWSIAQRTATLQWSGTDTRAYNGKASDVTATVGNLVSDDVCTVTVTGGDKTNAGTYTATATALSNSNYKLPSGKTTSYTIEQVELSVASVTVPSKEYDGKTTIDKANCTITWSGNITGETPVAEATYAWTSADAGTKTFTVSGIKLTNADVNKNYELSDTSYDGTAENGITQKDVALTTVSLPITLKSSASASATEAEVYKIALPTYAAQGSSMRPGDTSYVISEPSSGLEGRYVQNGSELTITIPAGSALARSESDYDESLKLTVSSKNYAQKEVTLTFKYQDKKDFSGKITLAISNPNPTYGTSYTVTPSISIANAKRDGWTITYTGINDTEYSGTAKPTEVGEYTVKAKYEDEVVTDSLPGRVGEATATLTIKPKTAALQWFGTDNLTYGDTVNVEAKVTNLKQGDTCTVTVTGGDVQTAGKHTATATDLSNKNYALPDAKSKDYTVGAKALTVIGAIVPPKTYSGDTDVEGETTILFDESALVGTDTAVVTGTATWTSANAGTKTVKLTNAACDNTNYSVVEAWSNIPAYSTYADGTGNAQAIAPKKLDVSVSSVAAKTYDGTTAGEGTLAVAGVIGSDDVKATGTFTWTSANAGTAKVNVTGITLTGKQSANYYTADAALRNKPAPNEVKIAKVANEWMTKPTINDWTYGTPAKPAAVSKYGKVNLTWSKSEDGVFGAPVAKMPTTVGTYKMIATVLAGDNFEGLEKEVEFKITAKALTISGITANNKEYDGNTAATLDLTRAVLDGLVGDDTVELDATGEFANADKGDNKTVNLTCKLTGVNAPNYTIGTGSQKTATASISETLIYIESGEIDVSDKTYDGKTDATVTASDLVVKKSGGESVDVTISNLKARFVDANAGTVKVVELYGATVPSGYAIDWSKTNDKLGLTANIAPITVSNDNVKWSTTTFTYNGKLQAPTATITNAVKGETVTAIVSGAKKDVNPDELSYTAKVTGLSSENYERDGEPATSFFIAPKPVTISGVTAMYDNGVKLSGGTVSGLIPGDDVTITLELADGYVTPDPGEGKRVDYTATLNSGNYTVTKTNSVTVDIPLAVAEVVPPQDAVVDTGDVVIANVAEQAVVTAAAGGVSVSGEDTNMNGIINAANKVAADKNGEITEAQKEATKDDEIDQTADDFKVKIRTELTAALIDVVSTDEGTRFSYDISAQYQVVATDGVNEKETTEKLPLPVNDPVPLKIPVPFESGTKVYITHRHEMANGRIKTYQYIKEVMDGILSFVSKYGLSEFEFSTKSANFMIGDTPYATLQEAVDALEDGDTIVVMNDPANFESDSTIRATVNKAVSFKLAVPEGSTYDPPKDILTAGSKFELEQDEETKIYTSVAVKPSTPAVVGGGGGAVVVVPDTVVVSDGVANGTLEFSDAKAKAGDKVTIIPKANEGYKLASIVVKDENGNVIPTSKNADGSYTFKMPESGTVTVTPTFEKDTAPKFVDVPANSYYAKAVDWAVENGITTGTSATTFSPDNACTRAEAVTFLYRAAGSPEIEPTSQFTDVSADSYYAKAVAWAVANGITKGTGDGTTFSPNEKCSRAQIVTFLFRYEKAEAGTSTFTDVPADSYYAGAVGWAVENGITNGTGNGTTFSPNDVCTRAQIVTFLYRCFNK